MKFLHLLLIVVTTTSSFAQLPCIKSNTKVITYSINGVATGNQWTITPELKPDVLGFGSEKKLNRVVFYTDVDSFVCMAKRGKSYQFYIILNGKDSALTEISVSQPIPKPARFSKKYIQEHTGKSSFEIPEAQELVHIVMALTPTGIENTNMVRHGTDYYKEVMKQFGPWKDHPAVNAMENHMKNFMYGHVKMDACGYFLDAGTRLRKDGVYHRMNWSDQNFIEPMVKDLEDFAKKSKFMEFFKGHGGYYQELITQAEKYMPIQPQWDWLEKEFPNRYQHYRITFSPLVNGWHTTNHFEDNGFKQTVMFICSAEGKSEKLSDKLWEGLMTRVVFSEIDHNYVNPISENYLEQIDAVFDDRAFWANDTLAGSYNSPYMLFNEYMTWAVFTLYAYDHYDTETFEAINTRVEKQMDVGRGFIKFKEFNQKLLELYRNRSKEKKVFEFYPDILAWSAKFNG
ncbi:MAG: DUF4932 domain-containing protein [Saprospiraceae bacterium]|nr:DUF4932 domain-containing protein [Saprospiraceae bacterium]